MIVHIIDLSKNMFDSEIREDIENLPMVGSNLYVNCIAFDLRVKSVSTNYADQIAYVFVETL